MKKLLLSALVIVACTMTAFAQEQQEQKTDAAGQPALAQATFGVRGNCGMCKRAIEKAAVIDGVSKAVWDRENKSIAVEYDPSTTDLTAIHTAIARSGYDTDRMEAKKADYDALPGCCHYDRTMEMSRDRKRESEEK